MKEYAQLLMRREAGAVMGRHWTGLWLLILVLLATFLSIAFSQGSMAYLKEKMDDPFTNWVNITNERDGNDIQGFLEALALPENAERFGYDEVQEDQVMLRSFFTRTGGSHFIYGRFFDHINTGLVRAILADDNVVGNAVIDPALLTDASLGVIITADALVGKLGYSLDSIPAYIDLCGDSEGADTAFGIKLSNGFAHIPLPVLAVVHKLPSNMDIVSTVECYSQINNTDSYPFNLHVQGERYLRSLHYYVTPQATGFGPELVASLLPDSLRGGLTIYDAMLPQLATWAPGQMIQVNLQQGLQLPVAFYNDLNARLLAAVPAGSLYRIYDYDVRPVVNPQGDYVSVAFTGGRLDSIRSFERFAKENFEVRIEMSQVNAKENFNSVTVMAGILSVSMILFSMACIVMFLASMLQSYFQKVKRNLGTFKAFGIDPTELIAGYVLLLLAITSVAIAVSLVATWVIQGMLWVSGIRWDAAHGYLDVWGTGTCALTCVIVATTVTTVYAVTRRLLRQTPGNLIYDR